MKKLFTFFCLIWIVFPTHAQESSEKENVIKVIKQLFDGMRQVDSAAVRSVFHPSARLQTTFTDKEGAPQLKDGSLEQFIKSVGTPHEGLYDERISEYIVEVDDNLATAWTPYEFYISDKFSHCGVNAFQLFKTPDGWRIIQIIDTRRKENCVKMDGNN